MTKFGLMIFPTDYALDPVVLGKEAEAFGFESLFFPNTPIFLRVGSRLGLEEMSCRNITGMHMTLLLRWARLQRQLST